MNGAKLIEGVKHKLEDERKTRVTNRQIADVLGITVPGLENWRKRKAVTVRQMVGLLFRSQTKAVKRAESQAIRPIVEFFKLVPVESKGGAQIGIFGVKENGGTEHPYLRGLREELKAHNGIKGI